MPPGPSRRWGTRIRDSRRARPPRLLCLGGERHGEEAARHGAEERPAIHYGGLLLASLSKG